MSNLINEYDKISVSLDNYSRTEVHSLTAEGRLVNRNSSQDGLSVFVEPPVGFDEEAEVAYEAWQECTPVGPAFLCAKTFMLSKEIHKIGSSTLGTDGLSSGLVSSYRVVEWRWRSLYLMI